jgi:PAS domain S-box-containing protein
MKHLPNLLIVDDTIENLSLLAIIIKKFKVNLIQAISGAEALEKTAGIELALAVIDVQMPEMNGYELAAKLNEGKTDNKVPVIFLTANYFSEIEVIKGYGSGAVDYIFKPVNSQILVSKINVFLDLFNQKQIIISNNIQLSRSAEDLTRTNEILKKREEKLQEEQLFTKALLDSIPGIFYLYTYPELKLVTWNKQHETLFGYDASEMDGRHVLEWHLPERAQAVMDSLKDVMGSGQVSVETPLLKKDGSTIPFLLTGVKFESKGKKYLIGIGTDITKRNLAEQELKNSMEQLHQLTKHIEKVRENERIAIARDLHDDLGQSLTAVKIDLGFIKHKVLDEDIVSKINKVSALVGETIKTVQRITSQLRPQIIDDLGLEAAIEWHTKEFAERNGIEVLLELDADIAFPPDHSLTLFRIMQESLTNIARHAKATVVKIILLKNKESIQFIINDNGIGINEEEINAKNSFGIMSMKERSVSIGGSFKICNENGTGTTIIINLPLNFN